MYSVSYSNLEKVPIRQSFWNEEQRAKWDIYLSISEPMSMAMPFRSLSMSLRSDRASSCFAFSTWAKQPDDQEIQWCWNQITSRDVILSKNFDIDTNYIYLDFLKPWSWFRLELACIRPTWMIWQSQFLPLFQMAALPYERIICIHVIPSIQLRLGQKRHQYSSFSSQELFLQSSLS